METLYGADQFYFQTIGDILGEHTSWAMASAVMGDSQRPYGAYF
jgi:hypothetical protein